jgi:hypothetical protein
MICEDQIFVANVVVTDMRNDGYECHSQLVRVVAELNAIVKV